MANNILNIGITGLDASRKALETTGHNIANVNTEGYSRKRVQQQTNFTALKDGVLTGSGVYVRGVNRIHDASLEKRMHKAISSSSYFNERVRQLERVEDLFSEVNGEGLNKILNTFYNSFRELANSPENESIKSVVRDKALLVVENFKRVGSSLNSYVDAIDGTLKTEVKEANDILKGIAVLNNRIRGLEINGEAASDLRDQRDLAIRNLAKSLDVRTYIDGKGNYNVVSDGAGSLVSGGVYQQLGVSLTPGRIVDGVVKPTIMVYLERNPSNNLTSKIRGGRIGSLVRVRNHDIKNLKEQLDSVAYELINTTNAVHSRGYVNRKVFTDGGDAPERDTIGKITGINFFEAPKRKLDIALTMDLSKEVKRDLSNIVTGLEVNSPGDNRVAIAISKLQHQKVMQGGSATLEEAYLQSVGRIGIDTGRARLEREQTHGILAQVKTMRERVSGVSIDEEAANMVRFQHAYDASAKVMQVAKDMFDTVLSIKR